MANRFGTEQHRPLLAIPAKKNIIEKPFVLINNSRVVIVNLKKTKDKKGVLLRLRSLSDKKENLKLSWPVAPPASIQKCTADEQPLETIHNELSLLPYDTETLYVTFKDEEKLSNKKKNNN